MIMVRAATGEDLDRYRDPLFLVNMIIISPRRLIAILIDHIILNKQHHHRRIIIALLSLLQI